MLHFAIVFRKIEYQFSTIELERAVAINVALHWGRTFFLNLADNNYHLEVGTHRATALWLISTMSHLIHIVEVIMLTNCDGFWRRVIQVLPFSRSELGAIMKHTRWMQWGPKMPTCNLSHIMLTWSPMGSPMLWPSFENSGKDLGLFLGTPNVDFFTATLYLGFLPGPFCPMCSSNSIWNFGGK